LGELDPPTLTALLAEGESLFSEHKADIAKGEGFQLAKASASFANTMGGWILIGVKGGAVVPDWEPPPGGFMDAVRQRLEGQMDPLPSFAAAVVEHDGRQLGVVRVYESADTPHILRDGSIVVREPAQDAKLRKRGQYEATPIRSHYELLQLAQRGERARRDAQARFDEMRLPVLDSALALKYTLATRRGASFRTLMAEAPALVLRLAPLTVTRRWIDWSLSEMTAGQLQTAACAVVGPAPSLQPVTPYARGIAANASGTEITEWTPRAARAVSKFATAAVDAGGALGLRLGFQLHQRDGLTQYHRVIGDGADLVEQLEPVVSAAAALLTAGEQLGRYAAHLYWLRMGDLYRPDPTRPEESSPPAVVPCSGELTVDGARPAGSKELEHLCRQWVAEFVRASGIPMWPGPTGS
jgi:hypothetical protein